MTEIIHDGMRLVPSREAARRFNITNDYIGRLCKQGKVSGSLISGSWYVNEESLRDFLLKTNREKYERREALREQRAHAYREAQARLLGDAIPAKRAVVAEKKVAPLPPRPLRIHPAPRRVPKTFTIFAQRGLAVMFAVIVVVGGLRFSDASVFQVAREVLPAAAAISGRNDVFANASQSAIAKFLGANRDNESYWIWYETSGATYDQPEISSGLAGNDSVIGRVIDAITPGSISEAILNARLAALESRLMALISIVPPTNSVAPVYHYYVDNSSGIGGSGFDDIDITNSTYTGGTITGATITGGSVTATEFDGVLPVANGGTGTSTYAVGDILYADSPSTLGRLAQGTNGQVLKVVGGNLVWSQDIAGGGGSGAFATTSDDLAIYVADPSDVVIIGSNATSTTGNILEIAGNTLMRGALTAYNTITGPIFTATSTTATSTMPRLNITGSLGIGSDYITDISGDGLSVQSGALALDRTGDWTGTFDGLEGSYYLANSFSTTSASYFISQQNLSGFSTTSADYWKTQRDFFATTSVEYWKSVSNFFSTTSAAYFLSENQEEAFSTTSAAYFLSQQNVSGFSTTSADFWQTQRNFFSTTSTDYWKSVNNFFSTTSADFWKTANNFFSTSSAQYFVNSSTTIPKTYTANTFTALQTFGNASSSILSADTFCLSNDCRTSWPSAGSSFAYPFPNDATSTTITFNNGIVSVGSTTINGNATTTGMQSVGSLYINGERFTDLTGSGLLNTAGVLSLDTSGNWTGTFDGQEGSYYLANSFSTTSASYFSSIGLAWSTTSANYYLSQNGALGFSTTSNDYWMSQRNFFSTTSANYWQTTRDFFSTTSAAYFLGQNQGAAFSTTSANYWESQQTARTADDLSNNSIEDLSDVAAMTENYGDLLYWNGSSWADIATSSLGLVTSSELGAYLSLASWYATTTDGLDEGSANLYFTNARVQSYLDTVGKGYFFSTTSADAWKDQRNFFSTTSAAYFSSVGLAFSTTSNDYWASVRNFFSTTSASYFLSQNQGAAFSSTSANYFIHSSTTVPKLYTSNTWTGGNIFGNATTSYATTTNLFITDTFAGAGLGACNASGDKLVYNANTKKFECAADAGAGGGITSLRAQYSGSQTGSAQVFATSSDTNLQLTITSSGDTHTFTPVWSGVLAVGRGGTGISSTPNYGQVLVGDGLGGYMLAATSSLGLSSASFSTTSADYWQSQRNFFSTTSTDYWKTQNNFFSTTSSDYWMTERNFFSTTSASYFLSQNQGNAFSTTSAIYFAHSSTTIPKTYTANTFTALQNFANASSTLFSASYASTTALFANTASTSNLTISALQNGLLKVNASGVVSLAVAGTDYQNFVYPFPSNATSTLLSFNGGLIANASSSINALSSVISTSTSATSTNLFATNGRLISATTTNLGVNGETFTDLTGSGLLNTAGVLSLDTSGNWTGTFDGQEGSYYLANGFSTTSANYWQTTRNFFSTTSADYWGSTKGYSTFAYPFPSNATSTMLTFNGGLTAYASSTFASNVNFLGGVWDASGNLGIGNTSPSYKLDVTGTGRVTDGLRIGTGGSYEGVLHVNMEDVPGVPASDSLLVLEHNSQNVALNLFTNNSFDSAIYFGDNVNNDSGRIIYDGNTASLALGTNDAIDQLVLTSNGRVGIGTAGPTAQLNVHGDAAITGALSSANLTATGTVVFSGIPSALLATDASGNVYATTTLGGNYVNSAINSYIHSSTTISKLYTANTFTALQTFANASSTLFSSTYASSTRLFAGAFTLGSLNGPLQANNGVISATSSILAIYGGTGQTSYSVGDILYADSTGSLAKLPIGGAGTVLKVQGGLPSWQTDLTSGGGGGATAWSTTTDSLAIYPTDTTDVLIVGSNATATTNSIFEVFGRSYFSNNVGIGTTSPGSMLAVSGNILANRITGAFFTATSTTASVFPYASTTALSATTLCLASDCRTSWPTDSEFSTTSADYWKTQRDFFSTTSASYFSSIGLAWSTTSANYYLSQNGALGFSTTSNDYWMSQRNFFSTTSANYWSSLGLGFSTSSADAWKDQRNFFSTTSASYFLSQNQGNAFSTTSANYWETQQTVRTADDLTNNSIEDLQDVAAMTENYGDLLYWNGSSWADIATSSLGLPTFSDLSSNLANYLTLAAWYATTTDGLDEGATNLYFTNTRVQTYLDTIGKGYFFSTTSADAWKDQRNFFSTTSAAYFTHSSTTIAKTYTANAFTALQTFTNASSTLFSSVYASSTVANIGTLNLGSALTVSNGGTGSTTLTGLLKGNGTGAIQTAIPGVDYLNSTAGDWTGTFDGQEGSYYLANSFSTSSANYWQTTRDFFSTTSAIYFAHSSTTVPKTYTANVFTGANTFNGAFTLGSLNGPLQANNGLVSATTSIGVLYGGTGLTSAPTYGQLLVGNASGGYTLTATSSLGLQSLLQGTQGQIAYFNGTNSAVGTSTLFITTSGRVGVGTTTPGARLHFTAAGTVEPIAIFEAGNDASLRLIGGVSGNPEEVYMEFVDRNDPTNSFTVGTDDDSGKLFFGYGTLGTINGHNQMALTSGGNLGIGTSTPGARLSVEGFSLLGNRAVSGFFTATTTTASSFPYASTTAITATTASTTNLYVSSVLSSLLKTDSSGRVVAAVAGTDYLNSTSGDWTGTFDGQEGSYYLANSFSTSSANYWQTTRDFFSTTSAIYFAHSSTTIPKTYTANVFTALQNFANASSTLFSASYASTTNLFANTASTSNLTISALQNGLLKVNASGVVSLAVAGTDYQNFAYPFPSNATSTLLSFNGGLTAYASSTIGNGTQTGGLTISGGATTTGNAYFAGNVSTAMIRDGSNVSAVDVANRRLLSASTVNAVDFSSASAIKLSQYTTNGFLTASGGNGTLAVDTTLSTSGGNLGVGTSSPYAKLSVAGEVVGANFTATTTAVNTFPTLLSTNASTTNFGITGVTSALLATDANGRVYATTSISSGLLNTTGNWTGTFDGQEGSYYLANSFSTTSANYWQTTRNFFSTTSADYWETQQTARTADDLTNNSIEDLQDVAAMTENYGDLLGWNGSSWTDFATSSLGIAIGDTTGTLSVSRGGTGATSFTSGSLVYGSGTGALQSVATTTATIGGSLTYSGTFGALVGGSSGTLSLNLGNANTWTALQQFGAGASSTALSAYNAFFVGRTSTTTIRGDNQASTLPYASTTAITATTASTTNLIISGLNNGLLKVGADGTVSVAVVGTDYSNFAYPFPSNATSTLLSFNGGLIANASSSINALSSVISTSTNATSTTLFATGSRFINATTTSLGINSETFTDLTGTGLQNVGGALTLNATGDWTGTFDGQEGSYYLANSFSTTSADYWKTQRDFFSTTSAIYFVHSSTTIPKTYTANAFTALQNFANASSTLFSASYASTTALFANTASTSNLTISALQNGLLKVNASGVVSLAVAGTDYQTFGYLFPNNATSTLLAFNGGLTTTNATSTNATSTNALFANVGAFSVARFGATATSSFASSGALTLATALTVPNGGTGATSFTSGSLVYGSGTGALQSVATTTATLGGSLSYTGTFGALVGGASGTLSLNMGNANTWTALQSFSNASSTLFSASYASTTALFANTASTSNLTISALQNGLLKVNGSGVVSLAVAGTDYQNFAYPFALTGNATSTLTQFNGGLTAYASSTIGNGTQAGGLTISGGATTTGYLKVLGTATSSFAGPLAITSSGTSTFANGIQISAGCFRDVNGNCIGNQDLSAYVDGAGNGSTNRVAYWSDNNTLTSDADFSFDGTTVTARDLLIQHTAPILSLNDSDTTGTDFRLDVADGTATFKADVSAALSNEYFAWTTNNNEKMRLIESGNLGIGATGPRGPLDVMKNGFDVLGTGDWMEVGRFVDASELKGISLGYDNNNDVSLIASHTGGGGENGLAFWTYGGGWGERMRLSNTGNLGIGTTTPQHKLSITDASAPQLSLSAGAGIAQWTQRNAGGNLYFSTTTVAGTATTTIAALEISGSGFGTTTVRGLNINGQATSTSNVGFNITAGCYAINGMCITGGSGSSFAYPFSLTGNATSTLTQFNGGLTAYASTTIGAGGQTTGLTISGGATTTGNAYFAGNVGINVTNPSDRLEVEGNINLRDGYLTFQNQGYGLFGLSTPSLLFYNDSIRFVNSGNNLMRVTSGGSVGIGTTSPYAKLSVVGDVVGARFIATTSTASIFPYASTTALSAATLCLTGDSCIAAWPTGGGAAYPFSLTGNATSTLTQFNGGLTAYASSTIGDGTQTGGLMISGGATTTGNSYTGGDAYFATKVGIGTSDPDLVTSNLTIVGSSVSQKIIDNTSDFIALSKLNLVAGETLPVDLIIAAQRSAAFPALEFGVIGTLSNHNLVFATNDVGRLTVTAGGNVGIGTTSPSSLLTVFSTTSPQLSLSAGGGIAQWTQRNAGGNLYFSTTTLDGLATTSLAALSIRGATGNVGVGTSSPGTLFSIGNTNGVNFTTATTTFGGTGGIDLRNGGCYAINGTCISAGGAGDGVGNWFTGTTNFNAVASATTTPIWLQAGLQASSTAYFSDLSSIGIFSFATTSTNATSTLMKLGNDIFFTASSTAKNTGAGPRALDSVTGGSSNTALGYAAASALTTSTNSTAVGVEALFTATTGFQNTAVGSQALRTANGSNNVAVGYGALFNATGNDNVGIGAQAGYNVSSGNNNIILGSYSVSGGISSGSNNIVIGDSVTSGISPTGSNQLNIGNLLYGTGLGNGAALSASGRIAIGTSTPQYRLTSFDSTAPQLSLSAGAGLNQWAFRNAGGNLYFSTTTISGLATTTSPAFMLDGLTGRLGLGTSSPWASLSVLATGGSPQFVIGSTTTQFIVDAFGNVGVATTSPYARLSVAGAAAASYFNADSASATSTFAGGLDVGGGALKYDYSSGLTSIQNLALGALTFDTDGGILSWVDMPVTSSAAVGTVESYSAQIDGTSILTVYSESDGIGGIKATSTKIGIGTTTPFAKLAIQASDVQTAPLFEIASTSSATKFLSVSGTGFGTTTLSGLNISGSATSTSNVGFNITAGCYAINGTCITGGGGGGSGGGSWSTTTSPVSGQLVNYPNNATDVVAIGSNSTTTAEYWFDPNAGISYLSGNVGIGTLNPVSSLDLGPAANGRGIAWGGSSGNANYSNIFSSYSAAALVLATGLRASTTADVYESSYGSSISRTAIRLNPYGSNAAGSIQFFTDSASTVAVGTEITPTERMRITSNGSVGIGTSTPYSGDKLSIYGGNLFLANTASPQIVLKDGAQSNNNLGFRSVSGVGHIGRFNDNGTLSSFIQTFDLSTGNVGIGSTTPWAKLSIVGNHGVPQFIIATTSDPSGDGQHPLFIVQSTTTGKLNYQRIGMGTTSPWGSAGLRDQLVVDGRIYSTWRYLSCDVAGSSGTTFAADTAGACGDFAFDLDADGTSILTNTTYPPYIELRAGSTNPTAGDGSAIRTAVMVAPATTSPVFEAWVRPNRPAGATTTPMMIVGMANTTFGSDTATLPVNGAYFIATSTPNWRVVTRRGGTETLTTTAIATSSTSFQKMRVELNDQEALFLVNGNVIARHTTNIPSATLAPMALVANVTSNGTPNNDQRLQVSLMRMWVDDPPGGITPMDAAVYEDIFDPIEGADIAEAYVADDPGKMIEGSIVSNATTTEKHIARSSGRYDSQIMGVIATSPKMVLGDEASTTVRVGMVGRVPVIVSLENGVIKKGDPITSSSLVGIGMKARRPGAIVGKTLAGFDPENNVGFCDAELKQQLTDLGVPVTSDGCYGRVLVVLDADFDMGIGEIVQDAMTSVTNFGAAMDELMNTAFEKGAELTKFVVGNIVAKIAIIEKLFVRETHTQTLCIADGNGSETCITKAQLDALLANVGVAAAPQPQPEPEPQPDGNASSTPPTDSGNGNASSTPPVAEGGSGSDGSSEAPEETPPAEEAPAEEPPTEAEPEPTPEPVPEPEPEPAPAPEEPAGETAAAPEDAS